MQRKKRVTIIQVAEEAGVSKQTVSRVLNNRPDVAPETRRNVQEVIERLDYRPSAVARSLIHQRSFTIGVVTAGLMHIGPSRTLNGITFKAEEMGYSLLLIELSDFGIRDIRPTLDILITHRVDGIIWAIPEVGENRACFHDKDVAPKIPTIFLTMSETPELSIVNICNYKSSKSITTHLIHQGCQHIGHIAGPLDWWEAQQRKAGWEAALAEANLEITESTWSEGNWSSRSGERAFRELLDKYPQMDAVFVGNDQMALSVLNIAHQSGIRIPQELAVVGFDGIPESGFYWPPLTTIIQNQHELGCVAVRELVEMINVYRAEKTIKPKTTRLEAEIIIRKSSLKSAGT
jgi:DNA-binding LacI/PurR family transcriptional regulator